MDAEVAEGKGLWAPLPGIATSRGPGYLLSPVVFPSGILRERLRASALRTLLAIHTAIAVASPPPMQSEATPRFKPILAQRTEQSHEDARARGADGMTQRTGAAVHVDLLVRQVVLLHRRHA